MEKSAATSEKLMILNGMLDSASRVCIISHMHPDGDAAGSCTAIYRYLTEVRGKQAGIVLPDRIQDQLLFLVKGVELHTADEDFEGASAALDSCDLVICLDFNCFSRSGCLSGKLAECKAPKVLIDHHLAPDAEAFDLIFSQTDISSASELLYTILCGLEKDGIDALPASCLEALLTGMTTDTNNFANSVFPSTLRMASAILERGIDRDGILTHLYSEYRENRVRAMGFLLSRMVLTPEGVAYMILKKGDAMRLGLRDGETEAFVNIPLSIGKVKFSIFIKEDDGYLRVSVRSRKGCSANNLARLHFHGGGHEQAAGGRILIPEDIADRNLAGEYIEKVTARFMKESVADKV